MIRIFVTNLGKYNEGELVGQWLELPASDEKINACLESIGIGSEYEEYFITDYETDFGFKIDEYDSIAELNSYAESIVDFDYEQNKVLNCFLEYGCNFQEAIEHVLNYDYAVYRNCVNMADVAYQVVDELGLWDEMPEPAQRYFDYEEFGRDLDIEGVYMFIGYDCYNLIF